ncbi:MAG: hypothetical protein K2H75_01600 [Muribaculaceae bacterium]|nr:hypothetical protein [Muribaculaceae bacterium]
MKFYFFAAALAMSITSMAAAPVSPTSFCGAWKNVPAPAKVTLEDVKLPSVAQALRTRSIDEPETNCVATEASFYYYGDILENGTGGYYLFLSSAGINNGNPTHEGQMVRIFFIGEQTDSANPVLPTGVYTVNDDFTAGTISASDSEYMDVFPHPDEPSSLVGYIYTPTVGTLTIENSDEGYSINFTMEGVLYNSDYEPIDEQTCTASYNGEVPYVDINGYTPIDGDIVMDIPNASGRYSDGDFSIAFYSDDMLDEDGFIVAAGQLFNVELFTEDHAPMNLDNLVGEYSPTDVFSGGMLPAHYMQGVWYEIFSGYYVALGTALTIYEEDGSTKVALAMERTITVTKNSENDYTIVFDLISAEGNKLTGEWSGNLGEYITDFSDPTIVSSIDTDASQIHAGKGFISAPADAAIFNIAGQQTGRENLAPGLYIVKTSTSAVKVLVK